MNQTDRSAYVPQAVRDQARLIIDDKSDSMVYAFDMNDQPCAVAFHGKAAKPNWRYRFQSVDERDKTIRDFFVERQGRARSIQERKEARAKASRGCQVGDVFECWWGYDQTNRDFYQVTKLIGKTSVELRQIAADCTKTGFMRGVCIPVKDHFIGDPIQKVCKNGSVTLSSFQIANKMDPNPNGTYTPLYYSYYG